MFLQKKNFLLNLKKNKFRFVKRIMGILFLMILASVSLGAMFLILFLICAKNDQFEEDETPALRILEENFIKEKK